MKTRARLMVGLLAAALTATACGSRLQTGELQAANGVLTRHTTTAGAAASTAGGGTAAAGPASSPEAAAGSTAAGAPEAAPQAGVGTGNAGGALSTGGATSAARSPGQAATSGAAASGAPAKTAAGAKTGAGPAAAAGGTGGPSGSAGGTPLPGTPAAGAKSEILLGSFGAASGILGAVTGTVPPAIRAWASSINAKGGLAGHPVRVILADDAGDPARTQAIVRQMVEQSHVVAFFAHYSFTLTGMEKYLESKGVPLIGGTGGDTAEDHSKVIYQPLMGAADGGAWGFLLAIAAQTD